MRRKEERSKQGHTNNKAKQHGTPKAVTLPRVGFMYISPMTLQVVAWINVEGLFQAVNITAIIQFQVILL